MMAVVSRWLLGHPRATAQAVHARLTKTVALAVFSSDAISSTAYATEEILFVTARGGSSLELGLDVLVPIAIAVAILLAIVHVTLARRSLRAFAAAIGPVILVTIVIAVA